MRFGLTFALVAGSILGGCAPGGNDRHDQTDDGVDDMVEVRVSPGDLEIDSATSVSYVAVGVTEAGFLEPLEGVAWSLDGGTDQGECFAGGAMGTITPDGVLTPEGTPIPSTNFWVVATSGILVGRTPVRVIPPGTFAVHAVPPGGQTGDPYTASVELLSAGNILSSDASEFGSVVVTGDFSGPLDLRITVVTVNGTFSTDLFQVLEKSLYLEM